MDSDRDVGAIVRAACFVAIAAGAGWFLPPVSFLDRGALALSLAVGAAIAVCPVREGAPRARVLVRTMDVVAGASLAFLCSALLVVLNARWSAVMGALLVVAWWSLRSSVQRTVT